MRGRGHVVDPPSGGDRSGVQESSVPLCGAREHGPNVAALARLPSRGRRAHMLSFRSHGAVKSFAS